MLVVGLLLLVCALMIARYLHSTSTFHIKTLKSVLRDSDPNVDNQTVLLVIAHPDDEAMFFGPSILSLTTLPHTQFHVLCLTTGNYDGLGVLRRKELYESCKTFGIASSRIQILDHEQFQDGPVEHWAMDVVTAVVANHINQTKPTMVLTFDSFGVSGHPNHIATYESVRSALTDRQDIQGYALISTGLFRKFLGPMDIIWSSCYADDGVCISSYADVYTINAAMRSHWSQYVWYRKLFISFSRYVYINTYRKL
eukprot:m.173489 g.173489  ORF g.173489 m.173489 type:complete len:254 (+) comp31726_c2_seq4:241-1002(+)